MGYEYIDLEKQGRLAFVTLNRPEKLNALSVAMQEEIVAAVREIEADPTVRVSIIKGAGRAFSAGYDIEPGGSVARRERTVIQDQRRLEDVAGRWLTLWDCSKPVIAQVHGLCLAGGTDLALLCDVVVAAEDARIGHPGVRGIGTPLAQTWAYLIGPMRSKMLMLTGDAITGRQAAEWGLAALAAPADRLDEEVRRLAGRMAAVPSDISYFNKKLINHVLEQMGFKDSVMAACRFDAMSHVTPTVVEFWDKVNTLGLKAGLKWRDRDFEESPHD